MFKRIQDLILNCDRTVWYTVNTEWRCGFLDAVVPFLRNQWTWVPLYLFLLVFMTINFGRKGWLWCVGFLITFAISDSVNSDLLKPFFHRTRPCNNPYLASIVHTLVPCGGGYSFPSSHAANHFSISIFSAITLQKKVKGIWIIAIIWAMAVSYSQVYVGVHYPLDVTCGALLGIITGCLTGKSFNRYIHLSTPAVI
jgi:membrane-associated phospholipid phosphatase